MENFFDFIITVESSCCNLIFLLIVLLIGILIGIALFKGKEKILRIINVKDWIGEYFDIIVPATLFIMAFIVFSVGGKDVIVAGFFTSSAICVAFFQERLKIRLSKPELTIKLANDIGEKTTLTGNRPALYYHLLIENTKSKYCLAKNVQCFIEEVWRKNEITGKFERLQLSSILVLKWSYTKAEDFRQYMDIRRPTFCDFGRLLKSMDSISPDVFEPYTYQKPGQFEKWQLKGKGTIGYKIIACADYFSSKSIYIMVDWDGKWVKYTGDWKKSEHTPEEMREHFKIRQIPENEFNREIGNIANSTNS